MRYSRSSSSACPGVFAFAINPPAFGGFEPPVQFVVQKPRLRSAGTRDGTLVDRVRHDSRV